MDDVKETEVSEETTTTEEDKEQVQEETVQVEEETAQVEEETVQVEEKQEEVKEETEQNPKEATIEQASEVLKDKGFDYAALQKEYNDTGSISQETRDKLAEVGITSEIVDNYIEGQNARVQRELDEISQCVGGRKQMDEIIQWAANNISDEEKISISQINDANIMKVVLKDLKNRMEEKEGKLPENQLNGDGGKTQVELYESQAQMFEAIRDPRYKTDEAYRLKVMKKIQASREAGIDLGI